MSAYTPDGSPLILMLVTIAVIGLVVWAVRTFFPAQRDK
jgi:Na+-transporting NADH:ubiquinone oxidoreductase subunit NqrD